MGLGVLKSSILGPQFTFSAMIFIKKYYKQHKILCSTYFRQKIVSCKVEAGQRDFARLKINQSNFYSANITAKSRKQFRNINRPWGVTVSMGERPNQRDVSSDIS